MSMLDGVKKIEDNGDHYVVHRDSGALKVAKGRLAHKTVQAIEEYRQSFADGGEVQDDQDAAFKRLMEARTVAPSLPDSMTLGTASGPGPMDDPTLAPPAPPPVDPATTTPALPDVPNDAQIAANAQATTPALPDVPAPQPKAAPGFDNSASINREAQAMQTRGAFESEGLNAQAKIERERAATAATHAADFQKRYAVEQGNADKAFHDYTAFLADPKNEIKPDRWWSSKSTAGKISASIGMILGGLGAGMTKGPNYAMQLIEKQIDHDMEAQKDSLNRRGAGMQAGLAYHIGKLKDLQAAYHIEKADAFDRAAAMLNAAGFDKASAMARPGVDMAVEALRQKGAVERQQGVLRSQQVEMGGLQIAGAKQQMQLYSQFMGQGRPDLAKGLWVSERMKDGKFGEHTVPFTEEGQDGAGRTVEVPRQGYAWNPELAKDITKSHHQLNSISRNLRTLEGISTRSPHGTLSPVDRQIAQQALQGIALEYNSGVAGNNRLNSEEVELIKGMAQDPSTVNLTGSVRASLGFMRQGINARKRELNNQLVPGTVK